MSNLYRIVNSLRIDVNTQSENIILTEKVSNKWNTIICHLGALFFLIT